MNTEEVRYWLALVGPFDEDWPTLVAEGRASYIAKAGRWWAGKSRVPHSTPGALRASSPEDHEREVRRARVWAFLLLHAARLRMHADKSKNALPL